LGSKHGMRYSASVEYLRLIGRDQSSILLSDGDVAVLTLYDSATATMTGGRARSRISTYDSSLLSMSGGLRPTNGTLRLYAYDSSIIEIAGRDFEVDGTAIPYGYIPARSGILTGTLASGDAIEAEFQHGGDSYYTGLIMVLDAPEPTTALLAGFALLTLTLLRRRMAYSNPSPG